MQFSIGHLTVADFPALLHEIPKPPATLNYRGELAPLFDPDRKSLAVVGARKYSDYGKQVVDTLISGLRGYQINIISGLALGIDSLAHKAALQAGLYTVAVPGSGIADGVIYPRKHERLAHEILELGGALLSEFPPDTPAAPWTFPQRNRIMAGLTHATLVIEATEKSGTLITARLATDYNRELLVVPGDIFKSNSAGPHQFLKLGATPVTSAADILDVLGVDTETEPGEATPRPALSLEEETIWDLLSEPLDRDTLIRLSKLETSQANVLLMQMIINEIISVDNDIFRRKH